MKPQYKLFLALLFASFLLWALGGCAVYKPAKAPKIIQVRITDILTIEKKLAELKGISMKGDTVYLRYGFAAKDRPFIGKWLSIAGDSSNRQREWIRAGIKANN